MTHQPMVLIVEDDMDSREMLLDWFEHWHIQARAVEDGETALKTLQAQHYDGIVIDLALPGLDGMSLFEKIRQQSSQYIPCIAITAFDNTSVRHHTLAAGFDAYLEKPLNEKALHSAIHRILKM